MYDVLFVITLFSIVLEYILSMMWVPQYFRMGIPVFYKRVNVDHYHDVIYDLSSAEQAKRLLDKHDLTVKQIDVNEFAVRERFYVSSRSATLHGLIRYIPEKQEIVAWGFVNWNLIFIIGLIIMAPTHLFEDMTISGWIMVPLIISIIIAIKLKKIINFKNYVEEITSRIEV